MDFAFDEDQQELRRYVRKWLEEKSASGMVRETMATEAGNDPDIWSAIAEMGWQAMAIPEEYGGAGFGFLELAVILEEQGRAMFTGPYFSTVVLAANALLLSGSESQKLAYLPRVAAGEVTATVAASDSDGQLTVKGTDTTATRDSDGWILRGTKRFVLDGHTSDFVLATATVGDDVGLFIVDGTMLNATVQPTMDETRKQAEIDFDGVRVEDDARITCDVASVLEHLAHIAGVALAVESVGGAEQCLDMSVSYAKDRKQFNRPIGSFQSVKHKCADMLVSLEAARSAAYYAAWAISVEADDVAGASSIAKPFCTDAFYACAAENIQIHGGIGFTWEHDAHLYLKRAKSSQLMFGSPQAHRRRTAEMIGI